MNTKLHSQLQEQIKKLDSIATAPAILEPLHEMMLLPSEQIRFEKVVELASYDGAIAAQCLRLANSPLFGRRQTETVRTAVMALGLERVRSMLLGLCVNRVIPADKWVIGPDEFWRHALGCALVTQRMARKIEYPEPEKAYLAGLLLGGAPEAFSKILGIQDRVHEKPEIVQQSSQVSFFGLRIFDFLCHSLRDECAAERVPPELIRPDHPLIRRDDSIHAQTEQHRAYSLEAESHDRGAHSFGLAPSEEWRICQAEALRRDRPVVRD